MNRIMRRIWLAELSLRAYFTHLVIVTVIIQPWSFCSVIRSVSISNQIPQNNPAPWWILHSCIPSLSLITSSVILTTCYISMSRRKSKIISAAIHLFNLWAAASGRSQCVQSCSIIHARRSLVSHFLVPHTGGEKHRGSDVCGKWCYSTFVILSVNLSLWWCVYIELNELYCHITVTRC